MRKTVILGVVLVGLVGCTANTIEVSQAPVDVQTSRGYVADGAMANATTLRTSFKPEGSNKYEEVVGACTVRGRGYSANFVTPAIVNLPVYGKATPNITVQCEYNGITKTEALEVYNKTASDRQARASATGAAVGGLFGALVAAGMSNTEKEGDVYVFANHTMEMN